MTSPQENHWWLCVQYSSADPMRVERFETQEHHQHLFLRGGSFGALRKGHAVVVEYIVVDCVVCGMWG